MLLSGSGYFIPMNSKYYGLFYLQMSSPSGVAFLN